MALVEYECSDHVATIVMNDPKTLNALSVDMVEVLMEALARAAGEARAVVLTGAGRGFCSGANLSSENFDPAEPGYDAGRELETHYNPLILGLRQLEVPVVAAVNGVAAGIGFPLALACDYVLATRTSYFLQAFRNIGLVPDGGSAYFLVRSVGRIQATAMMMLGERVPSETALSLGIINGVCESDDLMPSAQIVARKLADGPAIALSMMKKLAWAAGDSTLEEILTMERQFQLAAGRTIQHREGVRAFLEKRMPEFHAG